MKKILAVLFAAALLVAFTVPAMAKTYIGGIVFMQVYYYDEERTTEEGYTRAEDDFSAVYWDLMGVSRFKVRLTNEDNVGLFFEVGTGYEVIGKNTVYLRHLYGWWDITPNFRLIVGQTTLPFSVLYPDTIVGLDFAGKTVGIGYGEYDGTKRAPQVRFQWKLNDMGFVRLAFIDPHTIDSPFDPDPAATSMDNDTKLPWIGLGVPLYFGAVKIYPSVFYQKQTFDDVASGSDDTVTSWGAALGVKFGFGPLMVAAEVTVGDNWAWSASGANEAVTPYVTPAGDVEDAEAVGWWVDVSFKLGKITPHLIYGKLTSEVDPSGTLNDLETDRTMYGITARIPLAKGFMIRPEIMIYDREDEVAGVDVDYGKETVAGLTFQITF